MFNEFIQIAGIIDMEEAEMLLDCGVEYLGFPLRLPVNKEDLSEEEAGKIISQFSFPNHGILITYLSNADEIKALSEKIGTNIIQLHGNITIDELARLKETHSKSIIIKSLIIGKNTEAKLLEIVSDFEDHVDAFITDTYNPQTGATGATGLTHDWKISRALVEHSKKPIILAGGLTPENVYEAIIKVKPAGVDTHTGVEDNSGRKSKLNVIKFIEEARKGFDKIKEN